LLESHECEEMVYERPTLLRESFTLKNYMHATEKIVVKKNLKDLPYNQPMHKLQEMIEKIVVSLSSMVNSNLQDCVLGLIHNERQNTLAEAVVSYQMRQFLTMCEVFKLKLQSVKDSLAAKSSFPFLIATMNI
jgi:hypothetical protein